MIIGISGKIGSGKDTVGNIITHLTSPTYCNEKSVLYDDFHLFPNKQSTWKIKKFAGKLKECVSIITGISIDDLEKEEVKNRELGSEWNYDVDIVDLHMRKLGVSNKFLTVRQLLQKFGTEVCRQIHPNTWVNALFSDYKMIGLTEGWVPTYNNPDNNNLDKSAEPIYPNWIITDTRFPNEAKAIKDRGGIIIRVQRNETDLRTINQHESETALDLYKFDYVINNDGTIEELIVKVKDILIKEKII